MGVASTASGAEAITLVDRLRPDLLILDLGLPDVSGEEVAREVRRSSQVPILMLTAKAGEGAADLRARAGRRRLRHQAVQPLRARSQGAGDPPSRTRRGGPRRGPASFGRGALVIDAVRREVSVGGSAVSLTPTEWGLLVALANVPGRVYSRLELINLVRGHEFEGLRAHGRLPRQEPASQDRARPARAPHGRDGSRRRLPDGLAPG